MARLIHAAIAPARQARRLERPGERTRSRSSSVQVFAVALSSVTGRITSGWEKIIGDAGRSVGVERYGASADYQTLYHEFGITADAVAAAARHSIHDAEHGSDTVTRHYDEARRVLDQLAAVGVDVDDVTAQLERDGRLRPREVFGGAGDEAAGDVGEPLVTVPGQAA